MFGHDHNDEDKKDVVQPMSTQPVNNGLLGIDDDDKSTDDTPKDAPSSPPAPNSSDDTFGSDTFGNKSDDSDEPTSTPPLPSLSSTSAPSDSSPSNDDELLDIKKEALQELSPLIDHLEQNSEEKFRTTMMMIQASDNKELIPQAFKAAKEITNDKKRAQALLDIVNEINYFTHKNPAE